MGGVRIFNTHYVWEDCVSMILGVAIMLTSWFVGDPGTHSVATNTVIVGIVVLALGIMELADLHRWEEALEVACGLWLIASPFALGYADSGTLRYWHFGLGAGVVLLALLELRQDRKRTDEELAQHSAR